MFQVKGIKNELYEYQKLGVEFLVNSGGRALLADSPGVGKTAQALGFLTHNGHKRSLVVCPASVKFSWESEVKKWTSLTSFVVNSKTKLIDIPAEVNCIIINFDILKKFFNEFMKYHWDCMIIDECVIPQTYISTNKGQKQIIDLKPGEKILTYNLKDKVYEYKPLVKVIKKPLVKELTKVDDLICTVDHKIFDGKSFIEAKDVKKTFPMDFIPLRIGKSKEVLAGCLMGDGNLFVSNKGVVNARFRIGNCLKNEDYIKMKSEVIKELELSKLKKIWNNGFKPSFYWTNTSLTSTYFTTLYNKTYIKGERVIDEDILNMMGDAGLAVWFQDDGSCNKGVFHLYTCRYKKEGNLKIKRWFEKKYDISPSIFIMKKKDGRKFYYLEFRVKNSLKIYSIIRDYIVPSMRYKFVSLEGRFRKIYLNICRVCGQRMFGLHSVYQNTVARKAVCEDCKKLYKRIPFKNKNFKKIKPYDFVYDLEIKDNHNYFADGILIHNCHLIKSPKAMRSKIVKALSHNIKNVIMLTGTPLLSRPIEMFNMLTIIDPAAWTNYYSYATRYCEGRNGNWGFEAKGASNLDELRERIDSYFLRRTKEEVLKELPSKNFIEVPIDLPKVDRELYEMVEKNLAAYLKAHEKTSKEIKKAMSAEKLVKLNLLREINTNGKISAAKEIIDGIIEAGEKVLVFSSFNSPLKALAEIYEDSSVMILGETPVDDRGEIVKQFQEDPSINVFCGGFKSAGVGITLTAASNIVNLDLPWNPADVEQAVNRAHRPGADYESLNIYQILTKDSIDDFMKDLLEKKQEIIDQLLKGETVENSDSGMIDAYIRKLEEKHRK